MKIQLKNLNVMHVYLHCKKGGVTATPFIGVKHLCKNGTSCGVKIDTIIWCPGLTLPKVLHNDTTKWCQ